MPESSRATRGTRRLVVRSGGEARPLTDLAGLGDAARGSELVWLDLVDPTERDLVILREEFALHPLSIEDATSKHELPKIETYDTYWLLVVHGVTRHGATLAIAEIGIFVAERFVVTIRSTPPYPLDEIERRRHARDDAGRDSSGALLYEILDTVVDGYTAIGDLATDRVDALESRLFDAKTRESHDVFREIYHLKRDLQRFRRSVLPMRDILATIGRSDRPFGTSERAYLRDVADHTARVIDQLDGARDLLASALDLHFSVSAQRQSEVSKQLTIVATIFLPLTYVTGFFGQNFGFLTARIADRGTFLWLGLGSEIVSILLLVLWFRTRGWI